MKNILVLTSSFPRSIDDWWARFILNIYTNLPKSKYSITVLAPHTPGSSFSDNMKNVHIERFPYFYPTRLERITSGQGVLHNDKSVLSKIQLVTLVVAEIIFFFLNLSKKKYDLIHAHWILPQGLVACFAKVLFGTKYIITVHGSDIFGLRKFSLLKKIALNNAVMVTVNSIATFEGVRELSKSVPIKLIPMGIDTTLFYPKNAHKNKKYFKIVAVGRLIIWKGYEYLIRAIPLIIKENKNIKVIIVGNGPEKEKLISLANDLGVLSYVSFIGNISQSELSSIFLDSDVFVAPAITNTLTGEREGQGLAVIEAMAQGLPVVVSKSGGIQYLVEDKKTGLLVEEKDFKAIAKNVLLLLNNAKLRESLSSCAAKKVGKTYGWQTIGNKFDTILSSI